ncbi:hypothetical protein AHAS_Ahas19G0126800 [Arachis hypogaea]
MAFEKKRLLRKTPKRIEVYVGWKEPLQGWIKLNTDGAADKNPGIMGCGGLLRNHLGRWVAGFMVDKRIIYTLFGIVFKYFLAKIEGLEQKSYSEAKEGLQILLDSDLPALEINFLELQNPIGALSIALESRHPGLSSNI